MNKPKYKYGIYDKAREKMVINEPTNTILAFEFSQQVLNYISKHLGDSPNFEVADLKKKKAKYICSDCGERYENEKDWIKCPCKEQAEEELKEKNRR